MFNIVNANIFFRHENYVQKELLPRPEKYQDEIDVISQKYPGILHVSENEFQIECLEDELKLLLLDEHELDDILQEHKYGKFFTKIHCSFANVPLILFLQKPTIKRKISIK